MERCEALVPRADGIAPIPFEMGEEGP